jgi:hypothetical protein
MEQILARMLAEMNAMEERMDAYLREIKAVKPPEEKVEPTKMK